MNSFRFALARRRNALHYARESKRPEGLTSGRIDELSITELLFVLQTYVNTVLQVSTPFIGKLDSGSVRLPIGIYNSNSPGGQELRLSGIGGSLQPQKLNCPGIHDTIAIAIQSFLEEWFAAVCQCEQRHVRPELDIIRRPEDLAQRPVRNTKDGFHAPPQPPSQDRMLQVGLRLLDTGYGVALGQG